MSRIPGSMELWYDDGSSWRGFEIAPAGSASTTGSIAVVSRIDGSMELWFVGPNGSLQDRFWYSA